MNEKLQVTIGRINKKLGSGLIGSAEEICRPEGGISTGSLGLDILTEIGGFPKGRITELYGHKSSGKTTMLLSAIAAAQRRGEEVAYIDAEHALNLSYAQRLGVDTSSLLLSTPDTAEQSLDLVEMLLESGELSLIGIDSVAALTPNAEVEGSMSDQQIGLQARLMSKAMRKYASLCRRAGTALVFTNQIRSKVGIVFGNPEITPGGAALGFHASLRISLAAASARIKGPDGAIGRQIKAQITKSKVGSPERVTFFYIRYGLGIDRTDELLTLGQKYGVVEKAGSWLSYNGERLGQGLPNSSMFLKNNPDIANEIEQKVKDAAQLALTPPEAEQIVDDETNNEE